MYIFWLILLAILIFVILPAFVLSAVLFCVLLVRTKKSKWKREPSLPEDEEYMRMFSQGEAWAKENADFKEEIRIYSDDCKLAGMYFDFGFDKAVIIVPGRMETCIYSCFFAKPYKDSGYNVLVIDNRCYGDSEGTVSCVGFKEYKDLYAWNGFLEKRSIKYIVLHGVCVGASTSLFALTGRDCPSSFKAIVTDGMYVTFNHSFVNHMLLGKHPVFPFVPIIMFYISFFSGGDPINDGPIRRIGRLTVPALFLHSREDEYSLPKESEEMYNMCKAPHKTVWFDKGLHSRIRVNNVEKYDNAISCFLTELD